MRVLAIDVGVKNLSFCLLTDTCEVEAWEVLALGGTTVEANVRSLHETLRGRPQLRGADEVVIERQVRANVRMSCVASAALMFFLQAGTPARYVEASHKLRGFRGVVDASAEGTAVPRAGYRRTKALSVLCARSVLRGRWLEFLEALPKKDDAADSFTMAYSYVKDLPRSVRV